MEKKNKRKSLGRWTSLVLTFMFIGSWAVLGVALALREDDVNIGGTVNFTTSAIAATINKAKYGTKYGQTGASMQEFGTGTCDEIKWSKGMEATAADADIATWQNVEINFPEVLEGNPEDIYMVFTITNDRTDKAMYAKVSDATENDDNLTITVTAKDESNATVESRTFGFSIAATKSVTVIIQFHVENAETDINSATWNLLVELSNNEFNT